ncbi:MAG: GGDEF domain-containing protein, partial [Proteobacteria bacterium]|nr:GGDEF domain-containing protein [Pseudomonadota bacterium]
MNAAIAEFSVDPIETARLGHLSLFKGANLAALAPVLTQCPLLALKTGDVLVEKGQPLPVAYQLVSGRLSICDDEGKATSDIKPGEYYGAVEVVAHMPANEKVIVSEDCSLLVLDEDGLMGLINCSHTVARNTLFMLMRHVRVGAATAAANDAAMTDVRTKYARASQTDELTGLHNTAWLKEMLTRQIMRSATESKPLALLAMSVDGFDDFAKDFGHVAADQALCSIADLIRQNARPTDMYAIVENKEFVLALPDTDRDGGAVVAERLRSIVSDTAVVIPGECLLPPVTVSIG